MTPVPMDLTKNAFIPLPVSIQASGSSFELKRRAEIVIDGDSYDLINVANYLADLLQPATGYNLEIDSREAASNGDIFLSLSNSDSTLGKEGYVLSINEDNVILEANTSAGLFRGIQTIRQILPDEIESKTVHQVPWLLATGTIIDYPKYEYRSAMLDVCRHFFNVGDIKSYIDWLAMYKMNTLHLHLSDDQGWRIEIKKWPLLAKIGGSLEVGGGKGGHFSQEEYKEIVDYALSRYITIVPEIDMPGHTNAALASYAELNCNKKKTKLYTGTKVGFSSLCVREEITYQFIYDVISELAAITPGPYIHIGGDESHSTKKSDYKYFIERVEGIVTKHGKQLIGWDEIATTNLKSNSIPQVWRSEENAREAVNKGLKVILSPAKKCYLDMKYDSTTSLGLKWAGYIEVNSAYDWDPETIIPGIEKENILGIECPLWSETVTNLDEVEYMVFPRLLGYAEIGWTPSEIRNWRGYKARLSHFAKRMDLLEIDYYKSKMVDWN